MTISEQIVYGMIKPSRYKEILELKKSRWISYVIIMMLALSVISFVVPVASKIYGFGGFENLFTNKISDFQYSDNELQIEKPYQMSIGLNHMLIDTDYDTVPKNLLKKDGIYYAFGSKNVKLAYTIDGTIQAENIYRLEDILWEGFSNETLCEMIPHIYVMLLFMFIFNAIGHFISSGLFALFLAICVNSMNKYMKLGLSFGKVFILSFYGQSLYMVVSAVNDVIGLLPSVLVTMIGLFVTVHFVTTALITMSKGNQI